MSEDAALALLRLLAGEDGLSAARAAKKLGLGASELQRLLVALGDDPRYGGLDLVEAREEPHRDGARVRLWLSARGRTMCADARQDAQAYGRAVPRGDAA
ncbi:MAG: hypothetical protein ACOY82_17225 [Pseudomonadota bacterium]